MEGVTFMVAVTDAEPVFIAEKEGIWPVPEAAIPMLGSEHVHAKVAPAGLLVKAVAGIVVLSQTEIGPGTVTVIGAHGIAVQLVFPGE
jgi:hypothetical protein